MKPLIYFFLLFISVSISFGQSPKEMLKKINDNYDGLKAVELQMTYKLFKGYTSNEVIHEYVGQFANNREIAYRKISDAEFIHFKNYALKINHEEKVIVVSDAVDLNAFDMDFKQTLKVCKDITVNDKENGIKEVNMFIEDLNEIPYSKVKFEVDEKFWIKNITFYYATQSNFGTYFEQDLDFPRLEVGYNDLKKRAKSLDHIIIEDYITIEKDKIYPTPSYANYEVMDLRKK